MKVLVTGANGFVGRALCPYLAELGYAVVPVVRRQSCIADEVIVHCTESWKAALKGCDSVIHLAARAHVMQDQERDPLQAFRANNLDTTIELAKRASEAGVRRFVFMSTIKVNGEETAPGCSFSHDDPVDPKDPYAISKREAEQMLWQISPKTGMEVVVIRPPLVYGPGVKGNFMRLMQAIDKRRPLPLGGIQNQRSLIYLGNLVDVIRQCVTHPNAAGKTFLVSDGDDVSTPELVCRIAAALGRRPFLLPVPVSWMRHAGRVLGKQAAVDRLLGSLYVDIAPLREELGWTPPYTMQEGLEATAQWYRKTKAVV